MKSVIAGTFADYFSCAASGLHAATVLLHQGVFKASYAGYPT